MYRGDGGGAGVGMTPINVEAVEIPEGGGLDTIQVFWSDVAPGKGHVTITCYGCAWTAYWGGMGGRTIRQFFADADTHYLITKLGITPLLKQRKADHAYLGRIIKAIQGALSRGVA